jgi:hypothetical protein
MIRQRPHAECERNRNHEGEDDWPAPLPYSLDRNATFAPQRAEQLLVDVSQIAPQLVDPYPGMTAFAVDTVHEMTRQS